MNDNHIVSHEAHGDHHIDSNSDGTPSDLNTAKEHGKAESSTIKLAISATFHCLIGCGIGEVAGMIIATHLGMNTLQSIILSVVLGFVAGLLLGIVPLIRERYQLTAAIKAVILAEGLSIGVMEAFEVMTQIMIPGVMDAHLTHPIFWIGMVLSLMVGFIAALPVNILMISKGVRHLH